MKAILLTGTLVLALAAPLAQASDIANAELHPILNPQVCEPGGVYVDDTPYASRVPGGTFNVAVRYLGADAIVANAEPFDRFAGSAVEPTATVGALRYEHRFSKSTTTTAIGPSAVALTCRGASVYLTSYGTPFGLNPAGAGPHVAYEYKWKEWGEKHGGDATGPAGAAPFATPTSDLMLQVYLRAPFLLVADRGDVPGAPIAQLSVVLYLEHRTTRDEIAYVIGAMDNRPGPLDDEFVGCDISADPCIPFVSARFLRNVHGAPARYATLSPYSAEASATPWSDFRFFRTHITQDNLRAALIAANRFRTQNHQAPMPGDLENYVMTKLGVLVEVGYDKRANAAADDVDGRDNLSYGVSAIALSAWEAR